MLELEFLIILAKSEESLRRTRCAELLWWAPLLSATIDVRPDSHPISLCWQFLSIIYILALEFLIIPAKAEERRRRTRRAELSWWAPFLSTTFDVKDVGLSSRPSFFSLVQQASMWSSFQVFTIKETIGSFCLGRGRICSSKNSPVHVQVKVNLPQVEIKQFHPIST